MWLITNIINVCKTLRVLMRCVSVIAPAPGCRPHTGHISPAGARLSQKHCKNFSNLKPCKFSSRLSCQPGGGEQWRGNCKILAKCPPSRPRHLYIYLRQVRNTGLARREGGGWWVCFVQICKLSWLSRPGPLGKVVSTRNPSLCRHWPQVSLAQGECKLVTNNKTSIKICLD